MQHDDLGVRLPIIVGIFTTSKSHQRISSQGRSVYHDSCTPPHLLQPELPDCRSDCMPKMFRPSSLGAEMGASSFTSRGLETFSCSSIRVRSSRAPHFTSVQDVGTCCLSADRLHRSSVRAGKPVLCSLLWGNRWRKLDASRSGSHFLFSAIAADSLFFLASTAVLSLSWQTILSLTSVLFRF